MDITFPEHKMLQFPVFQLCGGSALERAELLGKMQDGLDLCHVFLKVVQEKSPHRYELFSLVQQYDLVVIDGSIEFFTHKIYLGSLHDTNEDDLIWLGENDSIEQFLDKVITKLEAIALKVPLWACVLIGGRSSRMGQPKHLLKVHKNGSESWLERTIRLVEPLVDGVVVSGKGDLPANLTDLPRIPDIPGVAGPLTGVLAAMRWQPAISWVVIACDMPLISADALNWLLSGRRPGCWGRLPCLSDSDFCEPLFAWYDGRGAHLLEEQLLTGNLRVGKVASHLKIDNPIIPERLRFSWQNVNTPEQLKSVQDS